MKVLITGGCGFLGSNLSLFYKKKGAEVIAYDNLAKHEFSRIPYMKPDARNYNKDLLERSGVKVVVADIRNFDDLMMHAKGCDYICHTAAQPAMTISWEDPVLDFTTNAFGTFNVLEVARKLKIPVAICSTVHAYGPERINSEVTEEKTRYVRDPAGIDENAPLLQGVITPLHASKRSNEIYAQAYIDTYKMDVACFRLTGIYGPNQFGGEDHGWVANFTIRNYLGEPLTLFGTGKQLRDILYASDVAEAFDAFYRTRKAGLYTLGGGEGNMISLIESINLIDKISGLKSEIRYQPERFGDLKYFVADSSKFINATGWKPKVKPEEGITNLYNWVKDNEDLFYRKR